MLQINPGDKVSYKRFRPLESNPEERVCEVVEWSSDVDDCIVIKWSDDELLTVDYRGVEPA